MKFSLLPKRSHFITEKKAITFQLKKQKPSFGPKPLPTLPALNLSNRPRNGLFT